MINFSLDLNIDDAVSRLKSLENRDIFIVLKTKNEVELLEKWIEHYSAIFGYESLIILDNLSDDPAIYKVYSKYIDKLGLIASFGEEGNGHNLIHYPDSKKQYLKFYQALQSKCSYFGFFDTDEFLVGINNKKIVNGKALYNQVRAWINNNEGKILHCYWLNSLPGQENKFALGKTYLNIFDGVKKGKYFLPSHIGHKYPNGHNSCSPIHYSPDEVSMNFWLLHHQSSSIERRIKVNYQKIKTRKMFQEGVTMECVMSTPSLELLLHNKNSVCNAYMNQIIQMVNGKIEKGKDEWLSIKGENILFSDNKTESLFLKFTKNSNFKKWISSYFKNPYSCPLNKYPMIDIGVYSEVEHLSFERVSGWIIDTASEEPPLIAIRWNGVILLEFNPNQHKEIESVTCNKKNYFELDNKTIETIKNKIENDNTDGILELIFRRTNKRLRHGVKKITIENNI